MTANASAERQYDPRLSQPPSPSVVGRRRVTIDKSFKTVKKYRAFTEEVALVEKRGGVDAHDDPARRRLRLEPFTRTAAPT